MRYIAIAITVLALAALAQGCTESCCSYCNATFVFEADCSTTFQELNLAAQNTKEFEEAGASSSSIPAYVNATHTTVSKCCPPFWKYYEDVSWTFPSGIDIASPCHVVGYSKSRSGLCDLGNDEENLKKLANASGVSYTKIIFNDGCENHE
eukprot:TRINITY_DN2057_c0_g1_i1.p1 TRINITY_DN2057_c0_g1~~TRINITY_DN2057_c0_g1_i1.p1  ORF type:complete len:159 (+),score=39.55 TRINITY_DN2057_c0_g1_i1:26-478(+)